jgi:hypothetical protein
MGVKKTSDEIKKEIKLLTEGKSNVVHFSMFGDNNYEALEAQIAVLNENMDEDEVYTHFENSDNPDDTQYVVSSAITAVEWVKGESEIVHLIDDFPKEK